MESQIKVINPVGRVFVRVTLIQKEKGLCLSLSGVDHPMYNGDARGGCGQIYGILRDVERPNFDEGWTQDSVNELHDIWERWHLNDMNAGTAKQMEFIRAKKAEGWKYNYDQAKEALIDAGIYNDDGKKYGHSWYFEALPIEIIKWFNGLQDTSNNYAWV